MAIRHQFTPVLTVLTDNDGTNPRFGSLVLTDSYSESCRMEDESIEDLTGQVVDGVAIEAGATAWLDGRMAKLGAAVAGELEHHPSPDPVTVDALVREAEYDMLNLADGLDPAECFNTVCEQVVPSDVTTLFAMVVADNRIGWLTADSGIVADDGGDVSPAAALEAAIAEQVKESVRARLTDEAALAENRAELASLHSAFESAGGRGIELADRVDEISRRVQVAEALS